MTNLYCSKERFGSRIRVFALQMRADVEHVAEPVTWRVLPKGEFTEPTMNLSANEAQQLMDELWTCGLRPSEGTGSAGSLAATERHLKDMQRLAFDLLERALAAKEAAI